eukprot:15459227-Alexandrium_andersonii.AAC.1
MVMTKRAGGLAGGASREGPGGGASRDDLKSDWLRVPTYDYRRLKVLVAGAIAGLRPSEQLDAGVG